MKAALIIDAPILDQKKIWVKKIRQPYFDHPFHYHNLCELVWVEKGHGKLIVGDYVGNFSEGELIFKNAGLPHLWRSDPVFYNKDLALSTEATTIYFPPSLVENITDDPTCIALYRDSLSKAARGIRFSKQVRKQITHIIKKVAFSEGFAQLGYFLQALNIVVKTREFQPLASIGYKNVHTSKDMDHFNEVYHFLLSNFNRNIKLEEIASVCNMTSNSFCRFFKLKTQKTFTRFLNELRIGHACRLLHNDDQTVSSICYQCGYNSPVNFFRFFKLVTGKTPQEYRKGIKEMERSDGSFDPGS